jgi:GTP-binding protein
MKISQCKFVISAVSPLQYPEDFKPEIALAGRSNVGKSSLTNMLINRKGLAKCSGTPGKTQTINFYDIDDKFRIVDLPGYGYARVSKSKSGTWGKIIETYLNKRENLLEVCLLVDMRHKPSSDDILMYEWIKSCGFMGVVIGTKMDKLKKSQIKVQQKLIRETLNMSKEDVLLCASAETREGKYQIWDFLNNLFEERGSNIYFERQVGEPDHQRAVEVSAKGSAQKALSLENPEEHGQTMGRLAPIREEELIEEDEYSYEPEDEAPAYEENKAAQPMNAAEKASARAMISSQLNIPKKERRKK